VKLRNLSQTKRHSSVGYNVKVVCLKRFE